MRLRSKRHSSEKMSSRCSSSDARKVLLWQLVCHARFQSRNMSPKKLKWPSPATETPAKNKSRKCFNSFSNLRNFQKTSTVPTDSQQRFAISSTPEKSPEVKAITARMHLSSKMREE